MAVSSALAAPMAAHAVKYKLSGQINRAITFSDDGATSSVQFVDNISSGTRWRMTGSEDIGNGMKVGFNWEWQNSSNPSSAATIKGPAGGDSQSMRKAEVWFSGRWGKLSVGQGDGAGNGTTEMDLSGTTNVNYYSRQSFGGGFAWRTSSGGTLPGGLTHGETFDEFDAFSRYDRVRYDTPALGPATVSGSVGDDNKWEVAARAGSGIGGGQLSAGVFYGSSTASKNRWGGSASYLFSQGTNITIAGAMNEPDVAPGTPTEDATSWYVKLGHTWGNNAASVGYGEAEDVVLGFKDKGWNIGFNHNIPKAKVDLYAGFHSNSLDTPAAVASVDDINIFVLGTKLRFD
jgi:predicted porin